MSIPVTPLTDLIEELDKADQFLLAASSKLSHARREETNAINQLNAAQKAVDARLAEMRASSPRGSDWALQAARPHSAVDEVLKK